MEDQPGQETNYGSILQNIINKTLTIPSSSLFTNHKTSRIDSNALCAIISFVYPNKSISQFKHVVPKTNDYELSIFGSVFHIMPNYRNILEVQGSINLIHYVKRGRLVMMKCEYKSQRAKSLFTTR
ncbi:hypothetical protein V8G54_012916 [Vigna mungo]|uniref:Uncharacterized protein n=1 Tax=Vigna mungo TaxID=3915 RepID=A0AAQ3NT63_VIGMU